jgi:hypothetical protein
MANEQFVSNLLSSGQFTTKQIKEIISVAYDNHLVGLDLIHKFDDFVTCGALPQDWAMYIED